MSDHLLGSSALTLVTYPRFVTEPDGKKLLFEARIGESGSGNERLLLSHLPDDRADDSNFDNARTNSHYRGPCW